MNKKLLCVSLALIFSWVTFGVRADDAENIFPKRGEEVQPEPNFIDSYIAYPAPPSLVNNFYFGFQLGGANDKFNTALPNGVTSAKQYSGGLFVGYGKTYNRFYLGFEAQLLANYSKDNSIFDFNPDLTSSSVSYIANFDVRPGYLVSKNFLPYLIFGLTGNVNSKFKRMVPGWRMGIGADIYTSDSFSIRVDYVRVNYQQSGVLPSSKIDQFDLGFAWHL